MKVILEVPDDRVSELFAKLADIGAESVCGQPGARIRFAESTSGWKIGDYEVTTMVGFEYIRAALHQRRVSVLELVKHVDHDVASNRVTAAIRRSKEYLRGIVPEIAEHLDGHLTAGNYVSYSGDWLWDLD